MAKGTDLRASGEQGITEDHRSKAAEALALVADHLATIDPANAIDEMGVAVLVGAKVYDVGGRSGSGGGVRVSRIALTALGDVPEGVTRREFAVRAAEAAQALGHDGSKLGDRRPAEAVAG
ncbi:hypothetical protein ABZ499_32995 [Streptomyces sp. NPDC019990]|uniref:hypothetical protein n=1 Tax=Streptomyces sp. NPDC019990 TaxID=3154693 RepID=UPI0033EA7540